MRIYTVIAVNTLLAFIHRYKHITIDNIAWYIYIYYFLNLSYSHLSNNVLVQPNTLHSRISHHDRASLVPEYEELCVPLHEQYIILFYAPDQPLEHWILMLPANCQLGSYLSAYELSVFKNITHAYVFKEKTSHPSLKECFERAHNGTNNKFNVKIWQEDFNNHTLYDERYLISHL